MTPSRGRWLVFDLLALLFLWSTVTLAQGPDVPQRRFSIAGRVLFEEGGQPAVMVRVVLQNFSGMTIDQTATDLLGNFTFSVSRGSYYVHVSLVDYADVTEQVEIINASYLGLRLYLRRLPSATPPPYPAAALVDLQVPPPARKEYEKAMKAFLEKGELVASLAHLQKAIEHYPKFANAYYAMGMIKLDLDRFEEARADFLQAIALNDKLGPAYFPLGALYLHSHEYEKAEQTLAQGLALIPNAWQGHYELARACLAQQKLEQAEKSALRAHELNPSFLKVHLLLANVYLEQGKDSLALQEAEEFLSQAGDEPLLPEVRKRIEELRKASPPAAPKQP